ncbi:hypothetical protein RHGRI_003324 [Rhododendron griersonianum]|uniref:CCHC-type domain-containing protein n=1 Tax=Rhododendron griersonianum TaxID=479676 RepID=A0AAV6L4N7_9ERIC|nr:hypothetical protein RHGRI_003324 [Rhododendron griersonianum]
MAKAISSSSSSSSTTMTGKTLSGLGKLIKVLPTGTVFLFHFLSPILTKNGDCKNNINKYLTTALYCNPNGSVAKFRDVVGELILMLCPRLSVPFPERCLPCSHAPAMGLGTLRVQARRRVAPRPSLDGSNLEGTGLSESITIDELTSLLCSESIHMDFNSKASSTTGDLTVVFSTNVSTGSTSGFRGTNSGFRGRYSSRNGYRGSRSNFRSGSSTFGGGRSSSRSSGSSGAFASSGHGSTNSSDPVVCQICNKPYHTAKNCCTGSTSGFRGTNSGFRGRYSSRNGYRGSRSNFRSGSSTFGGGRSSSRSSGSSGAFASSGHGSTNSSDPVVCQICNKPYHTAKNCWY